MVVEGGRKVRVNFEYGESVPSLSNPTDHGNIAFPEQAMARLDLIREGISVTRMRKCRCTSCQAVDNNRIPTEREILTVVTLARILDDDLLMKDLATHFLAHTALVTSLPLSNRRQPTQVLNSEEQSRLNLFIVKFSKISSTLLSSGAWSEAMGAGNVPCDISDLVDGRLFEAITMGEGRRPLPDQSTAIFEDLARSVCALSGVHLEIPTGTQITTWHTSGANASTSEALTILPFSNPVFDTHLTSINLQVAPLKSFDGQTGRVFREISHWHSAKKRLDLKQRQQTPASARQKSLILKRDQRSMAEMQSYAASLTNNIGKALEPELIIVPDAKGIRAQAAKENDNTGAAKKKPTGAKASANRKGVGKRGIMDDIAATKAIKDSESEDRWLAAWRTMRSKVDSERSLQSKYHKIEAYLRNLPDAKRKILEAEVQFHLLVILFELYRTLRKSTDGQTASLASNEELFGVISLLWDTSRRIATLENLTIAIAESLKAIIKTLNLPAPKIPSALIDRKLAYDPGLLMPKGNEFAIDLEGRDFQFLHCGPYMDRNLDSAPDSRVSFHPDGWQRRVLDDLDAGKSVFVVAPTSAGKTFISFYAMEKILRANNDDVLGMSKKRLMFVYC